MYAVVPLFQLQPRSDSSRGASRRIMLVCAAAVGKYHEHFFLLNKLPKKKQAYVPSTLLRIVLHALVEYAAL